MTNKTEWGPIVWRLLHAMANLSQRKDIYLLWASMLRHTAHVLPCDLCRVHMKDYLQTHAFLPKRWIYQTSEQNRTQIRSWVHTFHNSVNERLGKPIVPLTELPEKSFSELTGEMQQLYKTLLGMWGSQRTVLREWKRSIELLIQLLLCGAE